MTRPVIVLAPFGEMRIGTDRLTVIAGPCVLESESLALEIAQRMHERCAQLDLNYIFKASFDKANRSSLGSARGPGLESGLAALAKVRETVGVPVTTDIHLPEQADPVAEQVDVLQIPAFLCRQTDLLIAAGDAAATHHRAVNIKKGQFLSPGEMSGPVQKVRSTGCERVIVTERGTFFGYGRLVNDFLGLGDLVELDAQDGAPPVCFDCTHSAQLPGAGSAGVGTDQRRVTAGRRDRVPLLAKAAVAAGVHAVFMEVHPEPEDALSDAATMLQLDRALELLGTLAELASVVRPSGNPASSGAP